MIQTLEWTDPGVRFIDQTKLPTEETYVNCTTYEQVADVIRNMVVRGAPAIGVAAAMGIALGVKNSKADNGGDLKQDFDQICDVIGKTRPTAVNLFWAIRRMQEKFENPARAARAANQASSDRGSQTHARRRYRHQSGHGAPRRHSHASERRRAHALQCRSTCHRRLWHGARSNPRGHRARQKNPRLCGRNTPVPARLASHCVGTDERRHPDDRHLRQHGRRHDAAGKNWRDCRRRRPHRRQRRRRQQDRHILSRSTGQGTRHPVLRGRADFYGRPRNPGRQQNSHRATQCQRSHAHRGKADDARMAWRSRIRLST